VEYNDYRGVVVLAATGHIPLTGWGLVHKIDRAEALEDYRRIAIAEGVAGGLSVILLGSLLMFHRRDVMTRALKQEEKKFQTVLESPPDVMIVIDRTGHIMFVNSATERMFGYELEELLGKKLLTLVPERFRAESAEYYSRLFSNPALHDQHLQQDRWGLRKDGSEFPAEVTSSTIETLQGAVVAIAVRDITERKRAEAEHVRLITAIEQSAEAVVITNTHGDIEYVNPAFTRITGYIARKFWDRTPGS
jgi:PAS domain S-box-containing protein